MRLALEWVVSDGSNAVAMSARDHTSNKWPSSWMVRGCTFGLWDFGRGFRWGTELKDCFRNPGSMCLPTRV